MTKYIYQAARSGASVSLVSPPWTWHGNNRCEWPELLCVQAQLDISFSIFFFPFIRQRIFYVKVIQTQNQARILVLYIRLYS